MIENKVIDKIKFEFTLDDKGLVMNSFGESVLQAPQKVLNPYFDELTDELHKNEIQKLLIDFRELDYMNSGTVQPIIYMLKTFNTLDIPIVLIYSSNKKWQSLSFQALKAVTSILKNVSIESK